MTEQELQFSSQPNDPTDPYEYARRDDLVDALGHHLDVEGAAAAMIASETGYHRHCKRVEFVRELLQKQFPDNRLTQWVVCVIDGHGVGGHGDCTGNGTIRLPALSHRDIPNKHQMGGGAWSAAIADAANQIWLETTERWGGTKFALMPTGVNDLHESPLTAVATQANEKDFSVTLPEWIVPIRWQIAFLRSHLCATVGIRGYGGHEEPGSITYGIDASKWASAYNDAERIARHMNPNDRSYTGCGTYWAIQDGKVTEYVTLSAYNKRPSRRPNSPGSFQGDLEAEEKELAAEGLLDPEEIFEGDHPQQGDPMATYALNRFSVEELPERLAARDDVVVTLRPEFWKDLNRGEFVALNGSWAPERIRA